MRFEFELDDDGNVLAVYLQISDAPVSRTVEVRRGKVIVDEDGDGGVAGIEFLNPEHLAAELGELSRRYAIPDLPDHLTKILAVC